MGTEALTGAIDNQGGFDPQFLGFAVCRAFFTKAELDEKRDDMGEMDVVELINSKPLDHGQVQFFEPPNGETLHLDEFVLASDLKDADPFVGGRNII